MNAPHRLMKILLALMLLPMAAAALIVFGGVWMNASRDVALAICSNWIVLLLLGMVALACLGAVSFLSHLIWDQIAFLTSVTEALAHGKNAQHFPERALFQEFEPLYRSLMTHAHFHSHITDVVKDISRHPSSSVLPLRSEDDEFLKAINALILYLNNIHDVIIAIRDHDLTQLAIRDEFRNGSATSLSGMISELTALSGRTRTYANQIVRTVAQIASLSSQGAQDTKLITKRLTEMAQAIAKIGARIEDIAAHLQKHALAVDDTSAVIEQTSHAVELLTHSIEELKAQIEQNALGARAPENPALSLDRMDEATRAIEQEASASASLFQQALDDVHQGKDVMEQSIAGMHAIQKTMGEFFSIVKQLGERSEEVGETLEVISDIADHTNLLAINAAIISAHAGEHGRDFAVIADEIGKFAERTRDSASEIEALLRAIQEEFRHAMLAMDRSSKAMNEGTALSLLAGKTFDALLSRIESMREVVGRIGDGTTQQSQEHLRLRGMLEDLELTLNDKQDRLSHILWQFMEMAVQVRTISVSHKDGNARLASMAKHLDDISHEIGHVVQQNLTESAKLIESADYVNKLASRTGAGLEKSAQFSQDLLNVGGNLAFSTGEFMVSSAMPQLIPSDQNVIGFIRRGMEVFFDRLHDSIRREAGQQGFEVLELDSNYDSIKQVEQVNWLLKLPNVRGVILCPTDAGVAQKLVQKGMNAGIPFVAADETIATTFSVRSNNREGGRYAAELLMTLLPPNATIGAMVDRAVDSMTRRALGFRQRADQYPFDFVELSCDMIDAEKLKHLIMSAIKQTPGLQGIFLPNEYVTTAYLTALHDGLLPAKPLFAVGYDHTPMVEQAIRDGELAGAIFQQAESIGAQAFRQLHALMTQQIRLDEQEERTIYFPTALVTKENLDAVLQQQREQVA